MSDNPYESPRSPQRPRPRWTIIVPVVLLSVVALLIAVGVVCMARIR